MLQLSDRDTKISKRLLNGENKNELAKEYHISISTINHIYRMYNYRVEICSGVIGKDKNQTSILIYILKYDKASFKTLDRERYSTIELVVKLFNTDKIEKIINIRNMGVKTMKYIADCLKEDNYTISKVVQDYIDERMI